MSRVFEGYERQYCEISANLSKKCTSAIALDGGKTFDNNNLNASADQRSRLMMSTDRLGRTTDRIKDSRKTMLETEELGVSILQDLHGQRQSLLRAHETLHGVDDNVGKSKKILTAMTRRMNRNKWTIGAIITVLVLAIIFILYFKLTR
ncbi:hypothetical protein DY000_02011070 [Brassica cretica]|uniref:Vesicle transport v-SNARE N-terminal domain-containing protein n=1 Tax=Brassica cretica TaxID=69181 RepID=A0ABQ7DAN6_BRACR|nr:hypothetical protein DY000_02011070 [Brassica cretica]